jgi:hypothetical protein
MQVKVQEGQKGYYNGAKAEGETFPLVNVRDFSPVWMTPVDANHDKVAEQAAKIRERIYAEAREHGVRRLSKEREDEIEQEIVGGKAGGAKASGGAKGGQQKGAQQKAEGAGDLAE